MTLAQGLAKQRAMRGHSWIGAILALLAPYQVLAEDDARASSEVAKIMGKDAAALILYLGPPVQDVREGPSRKLQFANKSCILDVYLYPPGEGQTPVAVYSAARVLDGRDAERNSCITALRWRR